MRLRSFVWPWQLERHERLTASLDIAAAHPVAIDREAAAEWLDHRLADPEPSSALTVVWQSVTRQYWPPDERERVDALVRSAGSRMAIAQLAMEHPVTGPATGAVLTMTLGDGRHEELAAVADHGIPVTVRG